MEDKENEFLTIVELTTGRRIGQIAENRTYSPFWPREHLNKVVEDGMSHSNQAW
jgi:hypothetical protein